MAENATIHDAGEEGGLRNQLTEQMRDVLLPVFGERLVVARTSAECNDHGFGSAGGRPQ